jgi:hypothetical protein
MQKAKAPKKFVPLRFFLRYANVKTSNFRSKPLERISYWKDPHYATA